MMSGATKFPVPVFPAGPALDDAAPDGEALDEAAKEDGREGGAARGLVAVESNTFSGGAPRVGGTLFIMSNTLAATPGGGTIGVRSAGPTFTPGGNCTALGSCRGCIAGFTVARHEGTLVIEVTTSGSLSGDME